MRELIDEFLDPADYEIAEAGADGAVVINAAHSDDRDTVKRELYEKLTLLTGKSLAWGALTGVRPVKLAGELIEQLGPKKAKERLSSFYFLSKEKTDLITDIYAYQKKLFDAPPADSHALYIGIPFCPTRCLYCSFASNQVPDEEIARYMTALLAELDFVSGALQRAGEKVESVYVGGGTPTTLTAKQLETLLDRVDRSFGKVRELTVEAGRPDTITEEKLRVLKDAGVGRICINPQSMKQETLERIGRLHTPDDIRKAFELAGSVGFDSVNSDVICGLPGEDAKDFRNTLDSVTGLGADNVTVHTLAVKRGSRLHEEDKAYHYRAADVVREMLKESETVLGDLGFRPYYLYRQKHMAGSMENTGYCKDDKACLYNVRIMDEHQSTLAIGAGGISKKYYPEQNRLVRVPNVTNYEEYISRIGEMMDRKRNDYFLEEKDADERTERNERHPAGPDL